MLRHTISSALVAALLVVPAARPAQADGKDLVKVLAGIAVLYGVTKYIENRRGAPFEIGLPGRAGAAQPQVQRRDTSRLDRTLPAACEVTSRQGGLHRYAYDKACLERRLPYPELLPRACETRLPGHGGRIAYDDRCLAREGWQTEAYAGW